MRCQNTFQMLQQGGLAASASPADRYIFPLLDIQIDIRQRRVILCCRIGKCQIFDFKLSHLASSQIFTADGMARKAM